MGRRDAGDGERMIRETETIEAELAEARSVVRRMNLERRRAAKRDDMGTWDRVYAELMAGPWPRMRTLEAELKAARTVKAGPDETISEEREPPRSSGIVAAPLVAEGQEWCQTVPPRKGSNCRA